MASRITSQRRRRFAEDDPFFDEGNRGRPSAVPCLPTARLGSESSAALSALPISDTMMDLGGVDRVETVRSPPQTTLIPGMPGMAKEHMHICMECSRSFASDRLLDMHISETHDSFFAVLSEREPSYRCVVDGCDTLSWNDKERGVHLIEDHHFPETYDFHKPGARKKQIKAVKYKSERESVCELQSSAKMEVAERGGGDKKKTRKRKPNKEPNKEKEKEKEKENEKKREVKEDEGNMEVDELASAMERSLNVKIPANLSFGRRGRRSGKML